MTTAQEILTIGRLLKDKRAGGYKSDAARTIGVSRQTYDAWESGHFIPGDEWAAPLADYLKRELEEIVLRLFNDRVRKMTGGDAHNPRGVKPSWFDRPIDIPVAA